MGFSLKVATRFLTSNKGQTILIAIGIAIGVSVQIFIGSLIQGLQKDLVDKTVGSSSHITILPSKDNYEIEDYSEKLNEASNIEGIKYVSAAVDKIGFLKSEDNSYNIIMRGFDIEKADNIYKIYDNIVEGSIPKGENEILIGLDLKDELNAKIGDSYSVITPDGVNKEFKISGVYDLKVSAINKSWVITNLDVVQNLFGLNENQITSIEVQIDDVFEAEVIAEVFKNNNVFENLIVNNWKEENEQLLSGLNGQSISSIMIQVFVMISVTLGIASILTISVTQKSRQIGILKAMGLNNKKSSLIFLFQGTIIGILGAIIGIVLGLILAISFTKFAVNPDGTPIIALYIDSYFIILSGLVAILASVVASIIPAINSSKLNPMEVIRNG